MLGFVGTVCVCVCITCFEYRHNLCYDGLSKQNRAFSIVLLLVEIHLAILAEGILSCLQVTVDMFVK